ncbi:hypothetical protein GCM10010218_42570 [Streptomyces mashuensis]|uniref:Histidine kinase/HSP90-like ATPase domain-containing protein n=1 Tax=Streptomyces mashuensis TaxID=33904 RepID=A0A919B5D9_9ACTN|nr:ATP-binding protein [Streptomyces mashuensis]GHF56708.1 hypothetical protein GCM10010218_42570 [Streptomyces mashuensis]
MRTTVLNLPIRHGHYVLDAPAHATTPRLARQFVAETLVAAGRDALVPDARVCVSDVVTNVVQHARVDTLAVEVTVRPGRAVVAVRDGDPYRRPYRRHAAPGDERGRGLQLVGALSYACGVSLVWDGLHVVGKRVWFELRERYVLAHLPCPRFTPSCRQCAVCAPVSPGQEPSTE